MNSRLVEGRLTHIESDSAISVAGSSGAMCYRVSLEKLPLHERFRDVAKQVIYKLVDDIDGSAIDEGQGESIEFSLDGVDYVIDLKNKNVNEFRKKIEYYVDFATRVGGRKRKATPAGVATSAATTPKASTTKRDPSQTRAIRQWAADNGYEINDRGRIPAGVVEAYEAAN